MKPEIRRRLSRLRLHEEQSLSIPKPGFDKKELLAYLNERFKEEKFFSSLDRLPSDTGSARAYRLRVFNWKGTSVVIKRTSSDVMQGGDEKRIRNFILQYKKAVRNKKIIPKNYLLKSIPVIGRIRLNEKADFLIMPFAPGQSLVELWDKRITYPQLEEAEDEIWKHFEIVSPQAKAHPQIAHINVAGRRNGKWVFYLPYDYS